MNMFLDESVRQRWMWRGIFLAVAVVYCVFILRTTFVVEGQRYSVLADDAMISMQYARNLAEGNGLVWMKGGEKVEGYSNFMWTLWMAALHWVFPVESGVSSLVMLSGCGILLANLWCVKRMCGFLWPDNERVCRSAVLLTAFYYPLIYWTLRGFEVGLLVVLVNILLIYGLKSRESLRLYELAVSGVVAGACVLVRDDAMVPCFLIFACVCMAWPGRGRFLFAAVLLGSAIAAFGLHTAFRLSYYGDILPNTYYLKLEGVPLQERIGRGAGFLRQILLLHLLAPMLLAVVCVLRRRSVSSSLGLLVLVFCGQAAYSVWSGGDAWEWMNYANRFVVVGVPALLVLAAGGLDELRKIEVVAHKIRRFCLAAAGLSLLALLVALSGKSGDASCLGRYSMFRAILALLSVIALAVSIVGTTIPGKTALIMAWTCAAMRRNAVFGIATFILLLVVNGKQYWDWARNNANYSYEERHYTTTSLLVRKATSPDAVVAVVRAGIPGYFLHRKCVDLLGKNDKTVARSIGRRPFVPGHNKWNYDYSIARLAPDLVWELWKPEQSDYELLRNSGYVPLNECMYVKTGTHRVETSILSGTSLSVKP